MATQVTALRSVNPATEAELDSWPLHSAADVDRILGAVHTAAAEWRWQPLAERTRLIRRLGEALRADAEKHAQLITAEMGKPITEARAEVAKCAFLCDWCADNAAEILAEQPAPSDSPGSFVAFEPLGVVFAGMPWNFPYWQVFRCAVPAVAAGNAVALKHANNVTGCAVAIEKLVAAVGFPEGLLRSLIITVDSVAAVIADPRVAAVSLTGSTAAGRSVGTHAGEHLKKTVLELGGSDAFIVLDDADVDAAAAMAVKSRFQNAGQSCIAAKRFLVDRRVADDFVERLLERTRAIVLGDPLDDATQMGPLARDDLRENLERQLRASTEQGARLLCGGGRLQRPGWFIEPAVLDRCSLQMPACAEETFGPLAAVVRVDGDDAAVEAANASEYGLGGNIWTGDVERGVRLARRVDSGGVFINGMTHSDPRIPFGGIKNSGHGRELHSFGMREFTNVKTIWLPSAAES